MLLDPKRPDSSRAGWGWQFLLASAALASIAALSLVTLRPRSAVGQEPQPPAAEAASAATSEPAAGQPGSAKSAEAQRRLRQLERQLDERSEEAAAQRVQSEALRKQVEDLKAEIAQLKKGAAHEFRSYYLKYSRAAEATEILRTLIEQMGSVTGDSQFAAIKITPDPKLNALHVHGPPKIHAALEAVLSRLDSLPAKTTSDPNVPSPPAEPAPNLRPRESLERNPLASSVMALADRETQLELLKLDLQEAEIGLEAARKDLQRAQRLQQNNAISQTEIAKFEFQARAAEIKVMRAKIMLDGLSRQMAKPPEPPKDPLPLLPRPAR